MPLISVIVIFGVLYPVSYPYIHHQLPEEARLRLPQNEFLTTFRVTLIAKQTAIVACGALGMTLVIISGGIDLSVGSILALTTVVFAVALRADVIPTGAVIVALLAGWAAGFLNGLAITTLRLVPFIVTLGTMLVYRGLAERIANQTRVQAAAPTWITSLLDAPPSGSWRLVCTGVWIVIGVGFLMSLILRYTVFGRYVFAIGSNEATARLCGVNVPLIKIAVYSLGGLFMAIAGIFNFANFNAQGDPTSGIALELDIIAAVVIGGGSLSGGRGSILGSIVGALTMTTLRSGCTYAGVSDPVQKIVIGTIIIGAVAIDQLTNRGTR
jgi:ribose transport system permease protein